MSGIFIFEYVFQAEDGIRDLVRSRGLGDVYKRQMHDGLGVNDDVDAVEGHLKKVMGFDGFQPLVRELSLIHI